MTARVLIVDDDEHILRAMAGSLRRAGFDVTTATGKIGSPESERIRAFDVVIADYHLQCEMTGADVVSYFKARFGARVTCFVLSGEDDPDIREACLAAGAADVLQKPVSTVELRRRLSEVTGREAA